MKEKQFTESKVKAVEEDGTVRFRLTEKKVARTGEVVIPDGVDLANFKGNPIVLFGHGAQNQVPIGKVDLDSMKITKSHIDADVIFHDDGSDPFATMIAEKVRKGFLNSGSIGFRPKTISRDPVMPHQTGVTHKEWELMEFSVVPIPALPSATVQREWDDFKTQCKEYGHPIEVPESEEPTLDKKDAEALGWENITVSDESVDVKFEPTTADEFNEEFEEKAGRVLSKKNRSLISDAVAKGKTALTALEGLLEATDNKPAEQEEVDVVENSEDLADVKSFLTSHKLIKEIGEIRSINKNPEAPDAHNTLN